jgi:hypothetical protein
LFLTPAAAAENAMPKFIAAIGKHRHLQRDNDPPLI